MKLRFLYFTLIAAVFGCHSPEREVPMDIYLLIGQSNMAGRAEISATDSTELEGVFLFNDQAQWEPAKNPFNRYSTVRKEISMQRLGPGYGFAKALGEKTENRIGLVVNARGGSAIQSWQKGHSDGYFEEAMKRVKPALHSGELKAILWHQGESNSKDPENYTELFRQMVTDIRSELNMPELPFVVGQVGQWQAKNSEINTVISQLPDQISFTSLVTSDGLTPMKGDTNDPHFDTESQLLLGQRYAEKIHQP